MTAEYFKKQFPANIVSNIFFFVTNVIIGIWIVPYYIRKLGAEGYAFIPLATSIIGYVSLVTISLNNAVSRYLVIDLHRKNISDANKIFNTAFWSTSALLVSFMPLFALFSFSVPHLFNVPVDLTRNVQWLFFMVLVSFAISVFSSVFSVSTVAYYNRIDLRNWIDISGIISRVFFIIILFLIFKANPGLVGIAFLAGSLVSLSLSYRFFKILTPELKINVLEFDSSKLKKLAGMSGWMMIDQVGVLLLLQFDLILCNLLFGSFLTGQYAAVLQLNFLFRNLATVLASVFGPMILIVYAKDDKERVISISRNAVKFMALVLALPVGLLCGLAKPVLNIWLGEEFIQYTPLVWIFIFHLTINLSVQPLYGVQRALNKVRLPAIFIVFMGILNIILGIFLSKYCGWGVIGIASAGAIVLTLRNAIFVPVYAAHILGISKLSFIKPIWKGWILTVFIALISLLLSWKLPIHNFTQLFIFGILAAILFSIFTWNFVLSNDERKSLIEYLPYLKKIRRFLVLESGHAKS